MRRTRGGGASCHGFQPFSCMQAQVLMITMQDTLQPWGKVGWGSVTDGWAVEP